MHLLLSSEGVPLAVPGAHQPLNSPLNRRRVNTFVAFAHFVMQLRCPRRREDAPSLRQEAVPACAGEVFAQAGQVNDAGHILHPITRCAHYSKCFVQPTGKALSTQGRWVYSPSNAGQGRQGTTPLAGRGG